MFHRPFIKLIRIFYFTYFLFLRLAFRRLCIFDVDNTLADTWPSYLGHYSSEIERLSSLKAFPLMIELVKQKYSLGWGVIFMSARSCRHFVVTKRWLEREGIFRWNLFLVWNPNEKVELVKIASKIFQELELYDDLSYNHENGEVKFYEECIREMRLIHNLAYYGYQTLLPFQQEKK